MVVDTGVEQFAASLRGRLIQQGDAEYEEARHVFNSMIDRRPRFIARCADVADVIACVNFARDEGLLLSVRSDLLVAPSLRQHSQDFQFSHC